MGGRIEVAKSLRKREAGREQRIFNTQNLTHSARPANALSDVVGQALCSQTSGLRNVDKGAVPATALHTQCGVGILGHRLHRNPANIFERAAPQNRTRSTEEAGIPEIVSVLHEAVKQFVFVRHSAELSEISLKRIRGIELMRSLHQPKTRIVMEPSQCG